MLSSKNCWELVVCFKIPPLTVAFGSTGFELTMAFFNVDDFLWSGDKEVCFFDLGLPDFFFRTLFVIFLGVGLGFYS
jgi:hypothetical protein